MKVIVSGAGGLVGSALLPGLERSGHHCQRLVRSATPGKDEVAWQPAEGRIDAAALEGVEAAVHLAGESIAGARWTAAHKERVRRSRVEGTRLLAQALAGRSRPPQVLVTASAIGYYGSRGDEILREDSPPGTGFLADVCREWEAAAAPAVAAGIRVVHLRFGIILSRDGGALGKMLPPFRLGVGGRIGNGRQWWSWIAIDDVVGAIAHALSHDDLRGPVNTVSLQPATNAEFSRALGRVLSRPTVFPLPAAVARLALGEMADEMLLASTRVEPRRLLDSAFTFAFPELEGALRHVLGKERRLF